MVGLTRVAAPKAPESGWAGNAVRPVWTPPAADQAAQRATVHGLSEAEVVPKVVPAEPPTRRAATIEAAAGCVTGTALPVDGGRTAH